MKKQNSDLSDIQDTLSQLDESIKKLENQGVDVSDLSNDLNNIRKKLENGKEDSQEELIKIKKEASKECIFLRKRVIDTLKAHIESMIEDVKS